MGIKLRPMIDGANFDDVFAPVSINKVYLEIDNARKLHKPYLERREKNRRRYIDVSKQIKTAPRFITVRLLQR